ncbi:hypothetical protein Strvi_3701 [Streptomyces violaceusniger Tu 4113]|uniref:DUF4232 domain-containing protein n=1 Tax=Streptomyces violaceusniger (strain Tu 4113) TaxID=653045 RepID=G2NTK8_STRV4|nr:hypothetical protein Strvi_3701 [Streptomyces violaceusniger Tu 4113]
MGQRNGSAARRTTTSRSRSLRPPVLCALLVGALATVTACGSDTGDGDSAQRASSVTSASSAAPPSSPSVDSADTSEGSRNERPASHTAQSPPPSAHSASSRASSSQPAASGARRVCSKTQLTLAAGRVDVGAGNVYLPLVFTNKGSTTCTLTGYPGVSLLDSTDAAIGAPATRRGPTHSPITLPPGGSASAALHTLNEGMTDTPCRGAAARIRVYPPDSFDAMKISARSFRACGGVFEVEAMRSGTGG